MRAFEWDTNFETGIDSVDQQHRTLVDMVNELGHLILTGQGDEDVLASMFSKLSDYTINHFKHEEALMEEYAIDARHADVHQERHKQFVDQISAMWNSRATLHNPVLVLHDFLASWLTVHILGEDQVMAMQIKRRQKGEAANLAFERSNRPVDPATTTLLGALGRLYGVVSEQNRNLHEINQTLEKRIEERTSELAQANLKLMQNEKMTALGQMAAGIAHEINTPLGFLRSNFNLLSAYAGNALAVIDAYEACGTCEINAVLQNDIEYLRQDLDDLTRESLAGIDRIANLVRDMRVFSHLDHDRHVPIPIRGAIESTLHMARSQIRDDIELEYVEGNMPGDAGVPAKMNQVFLNLVMNAAQAIKGSGKVTVRSGASRDALWFSVTDTGCGIPDEIRNRIFEPFFTTKPVGEGTGLGLSICHDIVVKEFDGHIDCESAVGAGTTFTVRLNRPTDLNIPFRILVVEDEVLLREIYQDTLTTWEDIRIELTLAENGYEGLVKAAESNPDLMITDLSMPDMDGFKMIEALRKGQDTQNMPIVVISGISEIDEKICELPEDIQVFGKPVPFSKLRNLVNELIQSKKAPGDRGGVTGGLACTTGGAADQHIARQTPAFR